MKRLVTFLLNFFLFANIISGQNLKENTTTIEDYPKGQFLPAPKLQTSQNLQKQTGDYPFSVVLFSEFFESGLNNWTLDGSWNIGAPTTGPDGGFNSLNCAGTNLDGSYNNDADDWLISPNIYLPDIDDVELTLRFQEWFSTETFYDFGRVKISTDNGSSWTQLWENNGSSDWREVELSLTQFAGNDIQLAFHFTSDISIVSDGWFVDDIFIVAGSYYDFTEPYAPCSLSGFIEGGQAFLNWTAPSECGLGNPPQTPTYYYIYRNGSYYASIPGNQTQFTDSQIIPGESIEYAVSALYEGGLESLLSNTITLFVEYPDPPPCNLFGIIDSGQAFLNWTAPSECGLGNPPQTPNYYYIYRNGSYYASILGNQTQFTDSQIIPGESIEYAVSALYEGGLESLLSSTITLLVEYPDPPCNLDGYISGSQAFLYWTTPTECGGNTYPNYYEIERNGVIIAETNGDETFFVDSQIDPGVAYEYRVYALETFNGIGYSSQSSNSLILSNGTTPPSPCNLNGIIDGGQVFLNWTAPSECGTVSSPLTLIGYIIYRNRYDSIYANVSGNQTNFVDSQIIPGFSYTYQVSAVYEGGITSFLSNIITLYVGNNPPPCYLYSDIFNGQVSLTWIAPSGCGSGNPNATPTFYNIYRNDSLYANVSGNQTWFNDSQIIPYFGYEYTVSAVYEGGVESPLSNPRFIVVVLGGPPCNLNGYIESSQAFLGWTAPSECDSGYPEQTPTYYYIYRNGSYYASIFGNQTQFTDSQIDPGVVYEYTVYATTLVGSSLYFSSPSNSITLLAEYPDPPCNLFGIIDSGQAFLNWTAPSECGSGNPPQTPTYYYIYRNGSYYASIPGNQTQFTDSQIIPGESIEYAVSAVYEGGLESLLSNTITLFVEYPEPPCNLYGSISGSQILLFWTAPSECGSGNPPQTPIGYYIYRNGSLYANVNGNQTNFVDSQLIPGVPYEYTVAAVYGETIQSPFSNSVILFVNYPDPPCNLYGTIYVSQAFLYWTAPSECVNFPQTPIGYYIYRNGSYYASIPGNQTQFTDSQIIPGESIEYAVSAVYEGGLESLLSNTITLFVEYPDPPCNLNGSISGSQAFLYWTAPSVCFGGNTYPNYYEIRRNGEFYGQTDGDNTFFVDSQVDPGVVYEYTVYAFQMFNGIEYGSLSSNSITLFIGNSPPPCDLNGFINGSQAFLNWTAPSECGSGNPPQTPIDYYIYLNGSLYAYGVGNQTDFIDSQIIPGFSYEYAVSAVYEGGIESPLSNTIILIAETLDPPCNLNGYIESSQAFLGWTAPSECGSGNPPQTPIGYYIYRNGSIYGNIDGNQTYFTDSQIFSGVGYEYAVSAVYEGGVESPLSNSLFLFQEDCFPGTNWIPVTNQQYNMQIIGQIFIDGIISYNNNPYDFVGAFVGDECRGIAAPDPVTGLVYLTIGSNSASGEEITFKVWRSDQCAECPLNDVIIFENQLLVGNPAEPYAFNCGLETLNLSFGQGYTWFSVNVNPGSMAVSSLFTDLTPCQNNRIIGQSSFALFFNGSWMGSLTSISPSQMYKMELCSQQDITLQGLSVPITPINLGAGYTWLGFLPQDCTGPNVALGLTPAAEQNNRIIGQTNFAIYFSGSWMGSLTQLCPGKGYVTELSNSSVLTYPTSSRINEKDSEETIKSPAGIYPNTSSKQHNMNIVANVLDPKGEIYSEAELILYAFSGDECRGMVAADNTNNSLMFLTVGSDLEAGEIIQFKVWTPETGQMLDIRETVLFEAYDLLGTPDNPLLLSTFGLTNTHDIIPTTAVIGEPYPNPFTHETVIDYSVSTSAKISLVVFDGMGKQVYSRDVSKDEKGKSQLIIQRNNLKAGVYHYTIIVENGPEQIRKTGKLIIL